MRRSLRGRLLLALLASGNGVVILLCVAIYLAARHALTEAFDRALLARAQAVTALTEQDGPEVHFFFDAQPLPEFMFNAREKHAGHAYFEIRMDDGSVLGRSPTLRGEDMDVPKSAGMEPAFQDVAMPGHGGAGRSVTYAFHPLVEREADQEWPAVVRRTAIVVVAQDTQELQKSLWSILLRVAAVGVGAMAVSAMLTAWVIRRLLAPLTELAGGIGELKEAQSGQRVGLKDMPAELVPVVGTLNALLGRMDVAMARERGFTADVAHELRTPLAGLRTTIEVAQSRVRTVQEYEAVLRKCADLGEHVQGLIETLLMLARADAGQLAAHPRKMDLVERVDEWFIAYQGRAAARGITVEWDLPAAAAVVSDPDLLQIIVNNLFDNAVSYCDEGGGILIRIAAGGPVVLTVANSGCLLADVSHVFERFWRGDEARTEVRRHHGLGLSLSRQAADVLGHALRAEVSGGQFRAVLELR